MEMMKDGGFGIPEFAYPALETPESGRIDPVEINPNFASVRECYEAIGTEYHEFGDGVKFTLLTAARRYECRVHHDELAAEYDGGEARDDGITRYVHRVKLAMIDKARIDEQPFLPQCRPVCKVRTE